MEDIEYDLMDAAESTMWWYRALHRRLIDALNGVTGLILDAGCGTGGVLSRVRADRPDLAAYGVDFFPPAAARARDKSSAVTACASVHALPFANDQFDAILSADVLCHKAVQPEDALKEFARVLKRGGRLVLNMPAYDWLMSAHDIRVHNSRRTNAKALRALLTAHGFEAVRVAYWNSLLLPLMILERKVLARSPAAESDVKPFPPILDRLLFATTELERNLPFRLPAGGSVIAVAQRS